MKKLLILFIGVLPMSILNAQDISDALRYSTGDVQGTARFRAMSGAFGALGGDLSALSINPAGSAIFNRSHASLSISNLNNDTRTNYFGTLNSDSNSSFDLNQAGAVFVFNNTNTESPWGRFTLGLSYEQTQNFDDDFFASGTNSRSIDSYFLGYAQGLRLDEISAFDDESITDAYGDIGAVFGFANQQGFLGYESYILEPEDNDDDANTVYTSNMAPGDFYQEYSYAATGYNGKFGVNAAIQYDENIFLGLNLNSHFINYERSTYLYESNSNVGSLVNEVGFENNLSTIGSGFSFQLGTIAKVNESLRVGFSYDSPVWYTISEETTQYLYTILDDPDIVNPPKDPQIVNIFPDYKLQTPSKITGSAALVLGKQGLISFDYSRKDFSKTKFKPETDSHFSAQNMIINNTLKAANSYKIGGELRFDQLSLRGGYRFEESPYQDTTFYGDLTGYSLGLGYNFGGTTLDLAYQNSERDMNYQLYNVGLTDSAKLNTDNSLVTLTLNLRL